MRRACVGVAVGAALLVGVPAALDACGDKLLVFGMGPRFSGNRAEHPARILHYMDPVKGAGISDSKLRASLEQANHKLYLVRSPQELEQALRTGQYDIVLIDVANARTFASMIQSAPSHPQVLPTVESGKKDLEAAKKLYGVAYKFPSRAAHLLDTIDTAMDRHLKNRPKPKP